MDTFLEQSAVADYLISCGIPEDTAQGFILFFQAYQELGNRIETQKQIVAAWEEKPRCYGTKSFRNGIYLYMNHSPAQYRDLGTCPYHDWGKDVQKRHFVYVGKDLVKQDEATIALKNWAHWETQKGILSSLNNQLSTLNRSLKNLIDSAKNQHSLF